MLLNQLFLQNIFNHLWKMAMSPGAATSAPPTPREAEASISVRQKIHSSGNSAAPWYLPAELTR